MKHYKFSFCIAILTSFLVAFAPISLAETTIQGVVVNGSNSQNIAGVSIELRRNADPGTQGKLISTTVSGAGGKFSFKVPLTEHDSLLVAQARYKGFSYEVPAYDGGKRLGQFNVEIDPTKVRLPVFDTTKSLVPLNFITHHLEVKSRPGGISCVERYLVNNSSKKTFLGLGPNNATVLLDLPKGAKNVTLDPRVTDAKLVKNPGGYSIAKAILPSVGEDSTDLIVNYDMDWPSKLPWERSLDLSREIQYPTRFFFVQRSDTERGLQVKGFKISGQIQDDQKEKEENKEPLSPDQTVQLNISGEAQGRVVNSIGNPKAEEDVLMPMDTLQIEVSNPINPTFWAFLGFLLLLIILIPISLWRRSAAPSPITGKGDKIGEPAKESNVYGETYSDISLSQDWLKAPAAIQLIEQIAMLDNAHAAGEIDDDEFKVKRNAYKRALLQLAPEES